ncbi:hypothetical protein [Arthrobacter sp. TE12231]
MEQLGRSEGVEIRLRQPPRQLRPRRLHSQRRALLAPLDILCRLSGDQPPEEEVHDARAHGFENAGSCLTAVPTAAGRSVAGIPARRFPAW